MAESKAVRKLAIPNPDYSGLVARQREFFLSGATRPVSWRKAQLEALKALFTENHDDLCDALWKDLRRNVVDADLMDVAYNLKEADYALKHLDEWMKPARTYTSYIATRSRARSPRPSGCYADHWCLERAVHALVCAADSGVRGWEHRGAQTLGACRSVLGGGGPCGAEVF
jgi:hypothetical protein